MLEAMDASGRFLAAKVFRSHARPVAATFLKPGLLRQHRVIILNTIPLPII